MSFHSREDISFWFMKALGFLLAAIALIALLALTGCKDTTKTSTSPAGNSNAPVLSSPPTAPANTMPAPPVAESASSGTGLTPPMPMDSASGAKP